MVYKYKNNKWSRMIAARKLAAANRAKETAGFPTEVPASAIAPSNPGQTRACEESAVVQAQRQTDTGDVTACVDAVEHKEERRGDAQTQNAQKTGMVASTGQPQTSIAASDPTHVDNAAHSNEATDCAADIAPAAPLHVVAHAMQTPVYAGVATVAVEDALRKADDGAGLPRVVAACYVPIYKKKTVSSADAATTADRPSSPRFVAYVLQSAEPGTNQTMKALGVWDGQSEDSCLQVVHWPAKLSAVTSGPSNNAAVRAAEAATAITAPSTTREVVMFVNAEGQCFVLAPSSVVSVAPADAIEKNSRGSDDSDAAAAKTTSQADKCPYTYWLIPTCLKEHFLALLWAQQTWQTSAAPCLSSTSQSFEVQPHASRWIISHSDSSEALLPAAQEAAAETALSPNRTSRVSKKKGKAKKRRRVSTPPSAAPPPHTDVATTYDIPYVAKVVIAAEAGNAEHLQHTETAVPDLPFSAVFHVANQLRPFPSNYVF